MGKGDKKSRRGKIFMGSYGVRRPHGKKTGLKNPNATIETKVAVAGEKAAPKKSSAKKTAKKEEN